MKQIIKIIIGYKLTEQEAKVFLKRQRILGMFISMAAAGLAWYLYDWKLMLIILLALWGNNLEQHNK